MPRDLPIGNGHLLVNFDETYHLRDIYFPHVGSENHSAGHRFGLLQGVGGLLAPYSCLTYLAANAVQKVFRLLLGGIEVMNEFALCDEAEFQLCEGAQFIETFLAQPRRFFRS